MIFNSVEFFVFLALVVGVHWSLPPRWRTAFLLVVSYVFYGWWDWRFLSLIAVSTLVDYNVARRLAETEILRARRRLLAISVVTNLGILGCFKYAGFFVDSAREVLSGVGLASDTTTLEILLPVGISFYTFQTMAYTIDVFRERVEPCRDPVRFATYVCFFPQLVAGPIERADRLLPQLDGRAPRPDSDRVASAVLLIVVGLFKKVAIADVMAPIVARAFDDPHAVSSGVLLLGVVAFAFQIYGDFSGYTDIARGTSRLLGIELMRNFRAPYLSRDVTEFWRRWHISLSTWLRDYLYVPLGGNRRGPRRTAINLLVTMVLGGLWHGAAWTFVVWGGLHGVALVAHRRWSAASVRTPRPVTAPLRVLATFTLTCVAWVFFRAADLGQALDVLAGIVGWRGGAPPTGDVVLVALAALAIGLHDHQRRRPETVRSVRTIPPVYAGGAVGVMVASVLVASGAPGEPFIYFQF